MKILILGLLFVPCLLFADARKYSYDDHQLNSELDSIYHDLLYLKSVNVTASTGTFTYVKVSTLTIAGTQILGKLLQTGYATSVSAFSTTSGSYQTTNLSLSFTPLSSTSKIIIFAQGTIRTTNVSSSGSPASIFRDSTNLAPAGAGTINGLDYEISGGAVTDAWLRHGSMFVEEVSPGTSAVTYSVKIFSENGGAAVFGTYGYQNMLILEVL